MNVYDDKASELVDELKADAVALIVMNGSKGHGISLVRSEEVGEKYDEAFVKVLRSMADQIESGKSSGKKPV